MTRIGHSVVFDCSNGGTVRIIEGDNGLNEIGLSSDGAAYLNDLHINPHSDMSLSIGDGYDVTGSVQHVTGEVIMSFNLTALQSNGKADIKLTGLHPDAWYRLKFNGYLAKCDGGRANGKTSNNGILQFNSVEVPDE